MKFGIREICDVVLRAKNAQKIGNRVFYKNEPVIYFDTLKTSSLESQSTTVYAQGGRGNARLIAWEGERTVTFTMEDALISKEGFSILSGAGLIEATEQKPIIVHKTEIAKVKINSVSEVFITIKNKPYLGNNRIKSSKSTETLLDDPNEDFIYVMLLDSDGNINSEPYIVAESSDAIQEEKDGTYTIEVEREEEEFYSSDSKQIGNNAYSYFRKNDLSKFYDGCSVLVDYYAEITSDAYQINITPDKFSGNFYLEASTLFRNANGVDMPAEFIIPNCKIQSNFNFTMASSGDPSTFTFTLDAFPDYTRWNQNKKVFAAIQVIEQNEVLNNLERLGTPHSYKSPEDYNPYLTYKKEQEQYLTDEPESPVLNDIFYSIDENGNLYNGTGYLQIKKENDSTTLYQLSLSNGSLKQKTTNNQKINNIIITGYIPCKINQTIYVYGIKPPTTSAIGISLPDGENQGVFLYRNNSINPSTSLEGLTNFFLGCITGTSQSIGAVLQPLTDVSLINTKYWDDKVFKFTIDETFVRTQLGNTTQTINPEDIKYIRVCINNANLSEAAILVTDTPPAQESGAKLASSESMRSIHTFTEEENNDDDIDELLAYLEEQENNEK